jgi:hypothetical protein
MAGVKGKTNNPNGRPVKSRALTDLLVKALNKTIDIDGKRVAGKRIVANMIAQALSTGRIRFPNDTEESVLSIKDWIEFTRWAYQYLEPPIIPHEVGGFDGSDIVIKVIYEDKNG